MFSNSNSFPTGILNLFTNWMTSLLKSWHLSINIVCPVHCLLPSLPEPFVVHADLLQVIPSEIRGRFLVLLEDFFLNCRFFDMVRIQFELHSLGYDSATRTPYPWSPDQCQSEVLGLNLDSDTDFGAANPLNQFPSLSKIFLPLG